jgi:predicted permease
MYRFLRRLRARIRYRHYDRDLVEELDHHLEMKQRECQSAGLAPTDAVLKAQRDVGNVLVARERAREVWMPVWLDGVMQDTRQAFRALRRERLTTFTVVLTLALGIGVNTSVVAVAYGILYRALPYPQADRLVVLSATYQGTEFGVPFEDVEEWRARLRTVDAVGAYGTRDLTMRGHVEPQIVRAALVNDDFFRVLGVVPQSGRLPRADDDAGWLVRSSRLPGVDDRSATLAVGQSSYAVLGVMPPRFGFPSTEVGVWIPASSVVEKGAWSPRDGVLVRFRLVARLKPGASVAQFRDDAVRVSREIAAAGGSAADVTIMPVEEAILGRVHPLFMTFVASSILVLLIACANVASLLVGRAMTRQSDVAVRLALGASPRRLARETFVESAVLAVGGSLGGVLLSRMLVALFVREATGIVPRLESVSTDLGLLAWSAVSAFAVALLCGTAPALYTIRNNVAAVLNHGSTRQTPANARLRHVLVIGQLTLAVVLLTTATLLTRTVLVLLRDGAGVGREQVLTAKLTLGDTPGVDGVQGRARIGRLLETVARLPGVANVAVSSNLPPRVSPLTLGIRFADKRWATFSLASVTPGYFEALGIRLLEGRRLSEADSYAPEPVVVLSESAARLSRLRLGELSFPLPRGLRVQGRPRIVGIVSDVKYGGLDAPIGATVYFPWDRLPSGVSYLLVAGTTRDPLKLADAVRGVIRAADPALAVPEVVPLPEVLSRSIADRRARIVPAIAFAVLGLVIALVGLLTLMRRSVIERRKELAIRAALGASPQETVLLLMRQGWSTVLVGMAGGLLGAVLAARALRPLLYGVTPFDPLTWAAIVIIVASVATVTTYTSARSAAGIDPVELLRE